MGRRVILLLSAMAIMVVVAAGVALAVSHTFNEQPNNCAGRATNANDRFAMGGGNDACNGRGGNDGIFGDHGADRLGGGDGADHLVGDTGADRVGGGRGHDFLNVSDNVRGNDSINCGPGVDQAVKDTGDTSTGCDDNVTQVP